MSAGRGGGSACAAGALHSDGGLPPFRRPDLVKHVEEVLRPGCAFRGDIAVVSHASHCFPTCVINAIHLFPAHRGLGWEQRGGPGAQGWAGNDGSDSGSFSVSTSMRRILMGLWTCRGHDRERVLRVRGCGRWRAGAGDSARPDLARSYLVAPGRTLEGLQGTTARVWVRRREERYDRVHPGTTARAARAAARRRASTLMPSRPAPAARGSARGGTGCRRRIRPSDGACGATGLVRGGRIRICGKGTSSLPASASDRLSAGRTSRARASAEDRADVASLAAARRRVLGRARRIAPGTADQHPDGRFR